MLIIQTTEHLNYWLLPKSERDKIDEREKREQNQEQPTPPNENGDRL